MYTHIWRFSPREIVSVYGNTYGKNNKRGAFKVGKTNLKPKSYDISYDFGLSLRKTGKSPNQVSLLIN